MRKGDGGRDAVEFEIEMEIEMRMGVGTRWGRG